MPVSWRHRAAVGAFTFTTSFAVLWLMKVTVGIRTDPEAETAGLDVSEHGMWGYPEFYIPVPGGYGIYRWNAGTNNWEQQLGGAVRIDVDPRKL